MADPGDGGAGAGGGLVTLDLGGRVARLQLNRPDAANRITSTMMRNLVDCLTEAGASGADILVISAAGEDFSVGRDQHEQLPEGTTRADNTGLIVAANEALHGFPGVIVSSVRGRALGFGCGLVLQSHLSVAADTAVLGFDEIRHGLAPRFVMSYVEDYVGPKRALDLILTGRSLTAAEAERYGMVSRVVVANALAASTQSLVEDLLRSSPQLLATCIDYLQRVHDIPPEERGRAALASMLGGGAAT
ncbi:MAG: putative enoyl-CoA hydratase/isomerase, partial [Streptosporangiaceae bacterium]|nr:putative enoyl-CoA hydratase/isomerase [Streptosporangiaceae bacterium]